HRRWLPLPRPRAAGGSVLHGRPATAPAALRGGCPGDGCEVVRIGEPGEVSISVAASMGRLVGSLVADMARHRMIDVAPGKADRFCLRRARVAGVIFDF